MNEFCYLLDGEPPRYLGFLSAEPDLGDRLLLLEDDLKESGNAVIVRMMDLTERLQC